MLQYCSNNVVFPSCVGIEKRLGIEVILNSIGGKGWGPDGKWKEKGNYKRLHFHSNIMIYFSQRSCLSEGRTGEFLNIYTST